jgi:release factor glutamine methyltransferase
MLLANLPYVGEGEKAGLQPEITRHEPAGALFAGPDGLAMIGALISQLARRPRAQAVALEVGAGQAPKVAEMLGAAGFEAVRCECDLSGIQRVVIGERRRA